jgi:hypothetical protein
MVKNTATTGIANRIFILTPYSNFENYRKRKRGIIAFARKNGQSDSSQHPFPGPTWVARQVA